MNEKKVVIVADLGFGDAGKGSIVDYLARQNRQTTVVRYNGGPQAAHNVVTPEGKHHTFAHVGSGAFSGAKTHLSRFMLVNPFNLDLEIEHLEALGLSGIWEGISIDREAVVITPWHVAANRLRELSRGGGRHGSCGQGIGETQSDLQYHSLALRISDFASEAEVKNKLSEIRSFKLEQSEEYIDSLPQTGQANQELEILRSNDLIETCVDFYRWFAKRVRIVDGSHLGDLLVNDQVIFEGAQGVLLDEWFGFHPYTTWSTTTFENAETLLSEQGFTGEVEKLGLLRSYGVRHGPGPFPTEDPALAEQVPDYHNGMNQWQRHFRVGYLDLVLARYALDICHSADNLAITNLDRLSVNPVWPVAVDYLSPSDFLNREDGTARIRLGRKDNLDYQADLTEMLETVEPVYRTIDVSTGLNEYLNLIEERLAVPVSLLSFGPTAQDKVKYFSHQRP